MLVALILISVLMIREAWVTTRSANRFYRYFADALDRQFPEPARWPKVALLAPCKGIDPNLEENVQSWLNQDYPDFEIFFVVESASDPALGILGRLSKNPVLIAGLSFDCAQKIQNLRYAIKHIPEEFEVFAFIDSDAKVLPHWLRSLVRSLLMNPEGAVTGYRWYLAPFGKIGANFRAVWNASVLTLFGVSGKRNFAWGGSMAILRKTFFEAAVLDFWKGSISDDYGLTRAMHVSGRPISFVPSAMALTNEPISFLEFIGWSSRQFLITKIYHRHLWSLGFQFHVVWLAWILLGIYLHPWWFIPVFLLIQATQAIKGEIRLRCANRAFAPLTAGNRIYFWLLPPVMALLNLLLMTGNVFTTRIRWRDIEYKITGPNHVEVTTKAQSKH